MPDDKSKRGKPDRRRPEVHVMEDKESDHVAVTNEEAMLAYGRRRALGRRDWTPEILFWGSLAFAGIVVAARLVF